MLEQRKTVVSARRLALESVALHLYMRELA